MSEATRKSDSAIVWFRHDLRLSDHLALLAAVRHRAAVIPVYIWAPEEEGRWPPGAASRWWLHQSLAQLDASLRALGSRLILRRGPTLATLRELATQSKASAVYWNRRYEPAIIERDRQIKQALRADGLAVESFNGSLLFEPWTIKTKQGQPYKVFTPFWRACLAAHSPALPEPTPRELTTPQRWPASLRLKELALEPTIDWAGGLRASWQPGEAGAGKQLAQFREGAVRAYADERNRPDHAGTSRLSPHLHFGEISIREVWQALGELRADESLRVFQSELGWREFAHHLLYHFPHTAEQPLRAEFAKFAWESDPARLRAWQRGRTGFPIVDAGMRELWHTGWMHNRVRMIVASFLVKDLLISWQAGAAWFWDTLVDADLANNTLGWQWTAGCGADAAPFFRIFNPITQGQKFDPNGDYVRQWVLEGRDADAAAIHQPRNAIVDHADARKLALARYRTIK